VIALSAVVVLLAANDSEGWVRLPRWAADLWLVAAIVLVAVLALTRPSPADAGAGPAAEGLAWSSEQVRPGFERTYQRRRWTTSGVGVAALLLWANSKFGWGLLPGIAGVLAALAMTTFYIIFFTLGPSPAETRANRDAKRQAREPGA
jgi:hypothetical protein